VTSAWTERSEQVTGLHKDEFLPYVGRFETDEIVFTCEEKFLFKRLLSKAIILIKKMKFKFMKKDVPGLPKVSIWIILVMFLSAYTFTPGNDPVEDTTSIPFLEDSISFSYEEISGIGHEKNVIRRDPSDIIKVGNQYYIWYTRNLRFFNGVKIPGYSGRVWYATSLDGYSWIEKGEALGTGKKGAFDSHAVFTPNILAFKGKYYLYYTGVKPTPGNPDNVFENNDETDITAIGIAVADNPDGPFKRIKNDPILEVSDVAADFDSYRIDDAALSVRNNQVWLYYKGRSRIHGKSGPGHTQMGVAFSDSPEGPYKKHTSPLLDRSHEVLIWDQKEGVGSLASINQSVNLATDGLNFSLIQADLPRVPKAPGLYRPELTDHSIKEIPHWGISQGNKDGDVYLQRFKIISR